jgi:hypothetical protein
MYDIIGDVHGYAQPLKHLLGKLGYKKTNGSYAHPERKAVFTGDLVNRGPQIRKTVRIVRAMVENGNAFAILGNHEINAIIAGLKDKKGNPLIKPPLKNFISVLKTVEAFSNSREEWKSHLKWFRTLPLFLEMDGIRVIHACWLDAAVDYLKAHVPAGKIKKEVFRKIFRKPDSELAQNIWIITKGLHFFMPGDLRIINNKGVSPRLFRIRWWEHPAGKTFQDLSFESKFELPAYDIPKQLLPECHPYPPEAPPVFFGHYCRFKGPHIIRPNVCCVDSCVVNSKLLTAYRWEGEDKLIEKNLIQIN